MASSSSIAGSGREWLPIEELINVPPTHQNHLQITLIKADYPTNQWRYAYLRWEVEHLATLVVWRNNNWYILHHSTHSGHPYHTGEQIKVYLTPINSAPSEDEADNLVTNLVNLQIQSTPATIGPSNLGSPLHPRSIKLRTPTRSNRIADANNHDIVSTQTMAVMQTTARTLVGGGGGEDPLDPSGQIEDPQHIRDTFDIALG